MASDQETSFVAVEVPELDQLEVEKVNVVLDEQALSPAGGEAVSSGSVWRQILRTFAENKLAIAGVVILVLMILFCWLGPVFHPTNQINPNAVINNPFDHPPSAQYPLGTDSAGWDILGRLMYAGQFTLEIGFAAAATATVIGVVFGAVSGFAGGLVDSVMMRIVDTVLSIPALVLLIVLATIYGTSEGLIILIIGFTAWLGPARLIRAETLTLRTREYVQAVRVMGGSRRRAIFRHIIPNAVGTIVVNATFQVADAILLLAALGYIGLGLQLPKTDWGTMLSTGTQSAFVGYWWEFIPAGVCIVLVVIACNFIGDSLRDALEVRLRRR